jgi:hypothetical protein
MLLTSCGFLYGELSGEHRAFNWLTFSPNPSRGLDFATLILIFYSIFSIVDLFAFKDYVAKSITQLNTIHHLVRIYMLVSVYYMRPNISIAVVGFYLFVGQCILLYIKHGWLYEGNTLFRLSLRYMFRASVIWRAGLFLPVCWINDVSLKVWLSCVIFTLFDLGYIYFHMCMAHNPGATKRIYDD